MSNLEFKNTRVQLIDLDRNTIMFENKEYVVFQKAKGYLSNIATGENITVGLTNNNEVAWITSMSTKNPYTKNNNSKQNDKQLDKNNLIMAQVCLKESVKLCIGIGLETDIEKAELRVKELTTSLYKFMKNKEYDN